MAKLGSQPVEVVGVGRAVAVEEAEQALAEQLAHG